MPTPTFTDAQRDDLLAMAHLLDSIPAEPTPTPTPEVTIAPSAPAPASEPVSTDDALATILAKSKGVRATGETLVAAHIDKLWSQRKLSKVQAAAQGVVASEHNKAAWAELQSLRAQMLTAVRKHSRDGSHVASKIASKPGKARTPEADAFLLRHADNPAVQQLAALLGL